ncbi:MAG: hypothetical protein R3349_09025 [Geminicoccaceae bacterium]|nr:hypothetical protein [Geminicoccaceae bacterium]
MATAGDEQPDLLEQGHLYFVWRPKIDADEPSSVGDVERFYVVMRPDGGRLYRLMVIGNQHLPEIARHERCWGFIETITKSGKELEEGLRELTYPTKTRGERTLQAARPAGEAVYALIREGSSTFLAYALTRPDKPGQVQKAFNILSEASFALSVKNPDKGSPPGTGLDESQQADYPKSLQKVFRDRRFADEDPRLLDYEGAEVILVGAERRPQKSHGLDLEEEVRGQPDIFRHLRFAKSRHPAEPLLEGKWS